MRRKRYRLKKGARIFLLSIFSGLIIFGTSYAIVNNLINIISKSAEKQAYENKLEHLKEEEKFLRTEIEKLNDPYYILRYAAEEYLMGEENSIIFILNEE